MTHTEIVQKVRDILNEHGGDDAVSIGTDRVLLEEYIESAIPDAVIMLAQKGYRVNAVKATSVGAKSVAVPGFISLVYAHDNITWKKAVTKVTEVGSPEYVMAMNQYTSPGVNTPMCIKKEDEVLEFLPSFSASGTVLYNKGYDGKSLSAETKEATAVCYMAAALVLGMFGDDTGKQRLSDVSTNMLQ